MKILTIVVTYNALQHNWLYKCLNSLLESSVQTDIVVVDNNSTDSTAAEITQKYKAITLIQNTENLGFAKANNIGFKVGSWQNYDYVFLLNQDARIEKGTLQTLVQSALQFKNFGILSPVHLNGKGNGLDYNFSQYLSRSNAFLLDAVKGKLQIVYPLPFVNAACWLISKECLEKTGFFDDVLFDHYGEDNNFANRARLHNFELGVCPTAFIYHDRETREGQKANGKFNSRKKDILSDFKLRYSNPLVTNQEKKMSAEIFRTAFKALKYLLKLNFSEFLFYLKLFKAKLTLKSLILKQLRSY